MKVPDFIIAGTARAGTTTLYSSLRRHPQIFLPSVKEPCFFCFAEGKPSYRNGKFAFAVTEVKEYEDLYRKSGGRITGDVSTPYLFLHDQTIRSIKKYRKDPASLRVIVILRDPAERAFSQYQWKVRDGREPLTFPEAIAAERKRKSEGYSFDYLYSERGLYYDQVKDYLDNFPNVKIMFYDELQSDPNAFLREICGFVGADPSFSFPEIEKLNVSFTPRSPLLGRMLTPESGIGFSLSKYLPHVMRTAVKEQAKKINSSGPPVKMSVAMRSSLIDFFMDDIRKLERLTGRDLSAWMNPLA
jgi:hypothetical protein